MVSTAVIGLSLYLLAPTPQLATGYVFEDRNRNGKRDANETGVKGVRVSNQLDIVTTDSSGKWTLRYTDDTIFFVIKPRGYQTRIGEHNLPNFYYVHRPAGAPRGRKFAGVKPTGPLPKSIDFPLHRQVEPSKFRAVMFADTQPRDIREVEYIAHDVIAGLIGIDAAFGVTLGDIVFDDLDLFAPLNAAIGLIGIPWYNVVGNHDINLDVENDRDSTETFESVYGPPYYSFDYGPAHFMVIDDIAFQGAGKGYRGGIGEKQMQWIRNNLALVPKNQLVVLMMHIPLVNVADRQALYRLIENRPNVVSISGHAHYQEHVFIDKSDGWRGVKPHHHTINVTVSGSWWQGAPNELGIPHATMRDGAPNGYSIFTFDGNRYATEFRAAGAPASYQMNIHAPNEVTASAASEIFVGANVFGGSAKSVVEARLGEGQWVRMEKVLKPDSAYAGVFARDRGLQRPYRPLPQPMNSPHLWEVQLSKLYGKAIPKPGTYRIQVRERDMFGKINNSYRVIRLK